MLISATKTTFTKFLIAFLPLLFLLSLVLVLRAPNFIEPYWYIDEGMYLSIGQQLKLGKHLYADIVDHKTPILYWLASFAYTLPRLKAVLLLFSLSSALFFYGIVSKFFQSKSISIILTTVLVLALNLPRYEGNIFNGELIFIPFILAAVWIYWSYFPFVSDKNKRSISPNLFQKNLPPIAVGLLYGLAVLTKVPAIFEFAALIVCIVFFTPNYWNKKNLIPSLKHLALLVSGFIAPIILSIMYFYVQGNLIEFIDFGLLYNFRYISEWGNPFQHPIGLLLSSAPGRVMLLIIGLAVIKYSQKYQNPPLTFTLIWLLFSIFAATLSLRPYPHYLLQVIPPFIVTLGFITQSHKITALVASLFLASSIYIFNQLNFQTYPIQSYYSNTFLYATNQRDLETFLHHFDPVIPENYQISNWLQQRTYYQQPVYIHGDRPILYAQANVSPATKYTALFHVDSTNDYDYVIQSLVSQPPKFILDFKKDRDSFPELYHILDFNYIQVQNPSQADIYQYFNTTH